MAWNTQLPLLQTASAATHAGNVLLEQLQNPSTYSFVDICAGGGGPTPTIEKQVNNQLTEDGKEPAKFKLTDLSPHVDEWTRLSKRSSNIDFVPEPVNAIDARDLAEKGKKECRLFSLAFHHLDDDVAAAVLKNTIETADAIVYVRLILICLHWPGLNTDAVFVLSSIFELQNRSLLGLINVLGVGLGASLVTLFYFWQDPIHLLFTYLIPIIPFVFIFDGVVSCLRTRSHDEVLSLLRQYPGVDVSSWEFTSGSKFILPPCGYLHWFVGVKQ